MTSHPRRYTASSTHANSTGLVQEALGKKKMEERKRENDVDGWKLGSWWWWGWVRGRLYNERWRPLKEAFWSLKWREAVSAVWGTSGLQTSNEALKHLSPFQPAQSDPSARVCEAYSDPCWSLCVCMPVCMGKRKVWVHLLYLLFSLLPGCSRLLSMCVRGEPNDVCGCIWNASKKPSSPLLTVFSARRICQFSFSLFVLTLILLSKPWLASLTAAEHRSYSTPTNGTHQCFRPCTWTHTHPHTHSLLCCFILLTHTH